MAAPTKTAVEAERERLRAEGWTDEDIRQIMIQRRVQQSNQATGNFTSGPQMPMSGVLGNASAVLSHVRGTIPAIKADAANLANSGASRASRTKSAAVLVGVAVIVAVLGYALYQEWQIHIINAPVTAAAQASKTANEAAVMQSQTNVELMRNKTPEQMRQTVCNDKGKLRERYGEKYGCPLP